MIEDPVFGEIQVVPIGSGTETKGPIKEAVKELESFSDINVEVGPFGTAVEAPNLQRLFEVFRSVHEATFKSDLERVYTLIKIDDRRDISKRRLKDKVDSVTNR